MANKQLPEKRINTKTKKNICEGKTFNKYIHGKNVSYLIRKYNIEK